MVRFGTFLSRILTRVVVNILTLASTSEVLQMQSQLSMLSFKPSTLMLSGFSSRVRQIEGFTVGFELGLSNRHW